MPYIICRLWPSSAISFPRLSFRSSVISMSSITTVYLMAWTGDNDELLLKISNGSIRSKACLQHLVQNRRAVMFRWLVYIGGHYLWVATCSLAALLFYALLCVSRAITKSLNRHQFVQKDPTHKYQRTRFEGC